VLFTQPWQKEAKMKPGIGEEERLTEDEIARRKLQASTIM